MWIQDFWPKNGQTWPKIGIFGHVLAFLAHLVPWVTRKRCEQGIQMDFLLRGYPNFCFLPKKLRQKQIKFCLKLAKFVQFGQNIGNIGTFHPIPDHKTMQTMCLGVFLAFLFIFGQALLAHLVPCWWIPIYFIYLLLPEVGRS